MWNDGFCHLSGCYFDMFHMCKPKPCCRPYTCLHGVRKGLKWFIEADLCRYPLFVFMFSFTCNLIRSAEHCSILSNGKLRGLIKTFFKSSVCRLRRCYISWVVYGEHSVLFANVCDALRLVTLSVQLGLIRLAWDLNLLHCLCVIFQPLIFTP